MKRLAVEQLRNDVRDAGLHADVVAREDVRMIQCPDGARLALEPLELIAADLAATGQNLDRHRAAQLRVVRAIHLAHATRAEKTDDLVASQTRPRRERALYA